MIVGGGTVKLKSIHATPKKKKHKMNRYVYLRNQFSEKKHTQVHNIKDDIKSMTEDTEIVEDYNNISDNVDIALLEKKLRRYQETEKKLNNQLQKVREKIIRINSQL